MVDNSVIKQNQKLLDNPKAFFEILTIENIEQCLKVENSNSKIRLTRSESQLRKFLENYTCYGLFNKDELLGYCVFLNNFEQSELLEITIAKKYHNQGLAKQLLKCAFKKLAKLNINNVILEVAEDNLPAIKVYQNLGFKVLNIRKKYYNNQDSTSTDAIIMQFFLDN